MTLLFQLSEKDASNFACNAVVVGKTVLMHQQKSDDLANKLEKIGFSVK